MVTGHGSRATNRNGHYKLKQLKLYHCTKMEIVTNSKNLCSDFLYYTTTFFQPQVLYIIYTLIAHWGATWDFPRIFWHTDEVARD